MFCDSWANSIEWIPQEVQCWLRERKMALVLWFPHEGFNFNQGFENKGWLLQFHLQMRKHKLENAITYFVFGDLQAEPNYQNWLRTRMGNEKTAFEFTKTISYDFFHGGYWHEYADRTGVYVHRHQNPKHMHQEHYGASELTGGFTDHVIIPYEKFDAEILNSTPNQVVQDSYDRCKPEEILVGIPTAGDKQKDLICLNARPRSHRPVLVSELDRYVVGQNNAKRAVAIALRNRWRRQALKGEMKNEVLPKNILMIGPTGVGKTEISRRLSKLAEAPFVKVEATRFTEVGYVGRDVEQIVRDLIEIAISMEKVKKRKEVYAKAQKLAEEKVLDALVGKKASTATRESFRKRLRDGDLDNNEIEIAVSESGGNSTSFEIPGMPGANVGMINIGEMLGKSMGKQEKKKKMTVKESHEILINDESDKLIEQDKIIKAAKISTENNGIVFLDEIDKISGRTDRVGGDVSREGVQRDLLPLIEGTTVNTKYGPIKTDHILFIASGAFQLAKPSDLLPELQGRLPIRVELEALSSDDFKRILKEPDFSLIKQYVALLKTENVELEFTEDGIDTIANIASEVNATVENIGARRLHTIIEKILDEISFTATDRSGEKISINKEYINKNLDNLVKDTDLSKFIL